ncbi:hypothetical protein EMCG_01121 [[Emmonsia] crescens]|uniref:Uncharacterized protein n=1 Tax=[Emmonsia] crescens TaxID=73230 RepID=A0A0G2I7D4_9EURO|nr:hypothetical protein EMCG_01121 [Emmonsia crescens UAMH 3008]
MASAEQLDELRRQLDEVNKRADDEKKRADDEKKRADDEALERQREKKRADDEALERQREKKRADDYQKDQSPTTFLVYLQQVKEKLLSNFSIELDPDKASTGTVTDVSGKYYPLKLCSWKDFEKTHDQIFDQFIQTFSDAPLFPSKADIQGIGRDLSPTTRKDEQDLRPYVRTAIEKPAQRILKAYLEQTKDTKTTDFYFRNNAYSLPGKNIEITSETDESQRPPNKKRSPERKRIKGIPDRWGISEHPNGDQCEILVGEYKAAHKVYGLFPLVLSLTLSEDMFVDTLKWLQGRIMKPDEIQEKRQSIVAQVLCQAFHYIITSGLTYGYVTSGESLVFLMVNRDDPQTLYYHLNSVPDSSLAEDVDVRYSPASQLSTFVILSLHSTRRTAQQIQEDQSQLFQWPVLPNKLALTELPLRPEGACRDSDFEKQYSSGSDGDGDDADGDYRPSARPRKQQSLVTETTPAKNRRSSRKQYDNQQSTLSYCTQACLIGLSKGGSLDHRCPNVTFHQQGKTCSYHLFSKEKLCALVKDQLAHNLDENCECLDKKGMYGAVGVLFKISLTGYGYTFVAKGVQLLDEECLSNEASVYAHLSHLQGVAIPVYLGTIQLVRSYNLVSCAVVTSMMLMSWGGNSLHSAVHDQGVNIAAETKRSIREVETAGVFSLDVREANLLWNEEQQRVMMIDFDQVIIRTPLPQQKRAYDEAGSGRVGKRLRMEDKENMTMLTPEELVLEKKLRRKIDMLIMPIVIVVYLMNYIDRFCQTGLSILFIAYILMQVPSNLLLNYVGRPLLYLGLFTTAWGLVSVLTALVTNYGQIFASPLFAGALFYLSKWYTKRELVLRMSIFYSGSLIAGAFGNLFAAGILRGSIPFFIGLITCFTLPDLPDTWKLLAPELKHVANRRIAVESAEADVELAPVP